MKFLKSWVCTVLLAAIPVFSYSQEILSTTAEVQQAEPVNSGGDGIGLDESAPLNEQVQSLKEKVLELNRDLFILEEELLFPANTQLAVFLSIDVGKFFDLDAVELKIDDKTVSHYLYTEKQLDALKRGGVQRLFVGNLRLGEHEVSAFFTGRGPQGREYRRAASLTFEKTTDTAMLELKIVDDTESYQPLFSIVSWQ
jgi:hypothetical protein